MKTMLAIAVVFSFAVHTTHAQTFEHPVGQWVKQSPLPDGPPSPRMGYEAAMAYDPLHRVLIRFAGHNQGGGGEQNAETWTLNPLTATWTLKHPNRRPPGACCNQQNVFDRTANRFIRFPAFSGSHGWQWFREVYLNNTSAWAYDLAKNTWTEMRPLPAPKVRPLRCAAWDSDHEVVVLFGGEGSNHGTYTYDPYMNTWKKMKPQQEPPGRSGGNLAYDAIHKVHVLFGAQFSDDPKTWLYDLDRNTWQAVTPKVSPPTKRNDAVLCFDAAAGKVIAVLRAVEKQAENGEPSQAHLEAWAFDVGKKNWKRLPLDGPWHWGSRSRMMTYLRDLNVSVLESVTRPDKERGIEREQQIWTYRHTATRAPHITSPPKKRTVPRVVESVTVSVESENRVRLQWSPPANADAFKPLTYHVERAPAEVLSADQSSRLRQDEGRADTPAVASISRIGSFTRLTKTPLKNTAYVDKEINLNEKTAAGEDPVYDRPLHKSQIVLDGKPYRFGVYAYRIIAVTETGDTSGPSPYFLTIPSAPEQVFSREEGASCHVKWAKNSEAELQGYLVYRIDQRFSSKNHPTVTRMTPKPIKTRTFTDPEAGGGYKSRRYHIVAVDALGQEGYPSSPVWHNREWKKFYKPFVGEWHQ